jgi:transposase
MEQFIGCDAHKRFSVFVAVNEKGHTGEALRVAHDRQLYREFLARLPAHSAIAAEATGSYGWVVDEMERLGHRPKLCNPYEAKRRMGLTNKTDKLDATGLAILLRNGTLPEVWIPPSELRDQRELLRLRIFLVRLRTQVKNRIHATLARHDVQVPGTDLSGWKHDCNSAGAYQSCQSIVGKRSWTNWRCWTSWKCKSNRRNNGQT